MMISSYKSMHVSGFDACVFPLSLTEQKIMHLYLMFNFFAKPYLEVIRIYSLFCAQEPLGKAQGAIRGSRDQTCFDQVQGICPTCSGFKVHFFL